MTRVIENIFCFGFRFLCLILFGSDFVNGTDAGSIAAQETIDEMIQNAGGIT